jgi:hypothetical protein
LKGEPDTGLADPFVFTPFTGRYYGIGPFTRKGFEIGKNLMKR